MKKPFKRVPGIIKTGLLLISAIIFLFWFVGGEYLSYDPSDPDIGRTIYFEQNERIIKLKDIIDINLISKRIKKSFEYVIIDIYGSDDYGTISKPIPTGEKFKIVNIVYLKTYGIFLGFFKDTRMYYVVQNDEQREFITFWENGVVR